MRTLRWASELAFAENGRRTRLGLAALQALGRSPWLLQEDQGFLDAVLDALAAVRDEDYGQPQTDDGPGRSWNDSEAGVLGVSGEEQS